MKSKFLGRVALAALAGVVSFGMMGCDWKAGGPRDGGRRLEAAGRTAGLKSLKILSTLDETAAGKMFDGAK